MVHKKKYGNLTIAVFGRGGGVEHPDGIRFQRLDFRLSAQLASLFSKVILVPLVYRYESPLRDSFAGIYNEKLEQSNIEVLPVSNYSSFRGTNKFIIRIRAWITWSASLFHALKCSDYALIYFPSTLGLIGAGFGIFMGKPIIAYIGADWTVINPRTGKIGKPSGVKKLFLVIRSVVGEFLTNRFNVVLMRNYGLFKKWSERRPGVFYVPGNTSVSENELYQKSDTCLQETIVCLVVAALIPRKGVDDVVKAIAMLRQKGYPVVLWHAGASIPEYFSKITSFCKQLGIEEHVVFHGYKNELSEILSLYRKADIFVLASHSEGYPRVITEAQSQSLPVIASKVGGIPARLENNKDALLIAPGKSEEIASAIEKIIENEALRKQIIANGFAKAQQELCGVNAIDIIVQAIDENLINARR